MKIKKFENFFLEDQEDSEEKNLDKIKDKEKGARIPIEKKQAPIELPDWTKY
jgi:hypothetical protein